MSKEDGFKLHGLSGDESTTLHRKQPEDESEKRLVELSKRSNERNEKLNEIYSQVHGNSVKNVDYIIVVIYPLLLLLLTTMLPRDTLSSMHVLSQVVDLFRCVVPSVDGLARYSAFPQEAQLVYCLNILSIPCLCRIARRSSLMDGIEKIGFWPCLIGVALLSWLLLNVFSIAPDYDSRRYTTRDLHQYRMAFAFFLGLFSIALALLLDGVRLSCRLCHYEKR